MGSGSGRAPRLRGMRRGRERLTMVQVGVGKNVGEDGEIQGASKIPEDVVAGGNLVKHGRQRGIHVYGYLVPQAAVMSRCVVSRAFVG